MSPVLIPDQNNLDRNWPTRRQIGRPKPTIRELTNGAARLIANLQRIVVGPIKGQAIAADTGEDGYLSDPSPASPYE
jgi:hypothetical protein